MTLSLRQAAEFCGYSYERFRQRVKADKTIPVSRKGKSYRFIRADLEA